MINKQNLPSIGDYIKINRSAEKFWMEVLYVDLQIGMVTGIVDNDLIKTEIHGIKYKDILTVHISEIIEKLREDEL